MTQLAEQLMNQHEGGRVNYDDEDPDMEGWDDDSDESDNEDDIVSSTGSINSGKSLEGIQEVDGDSFTESGISEEDRDEKERLIDYDDDDYDDDLFEEMGKKNKNFSRNKTEKKDDKKKVNRRPEAFADADDYEKLITKSWAERDELNKRESKEFDEVKEYSTKKRKYEGHTTQRKKT